MVDVVKLQPFTSHVRHTSPYHLINNRKSWIGRCPGGPPRQWNLLDPVGSSQRSFIYPELSRCYPTTPTTTTTIDSLIPLRIRQQRETSAREPLKVTTVTTNAVLSNVERTKTGLSEALSTHISIKPEPLRPANNLLSSTLTIWKKYWTSIQVQRRRKEAKESESTIDPSKTADQVSLNTSQSGTLGDSSFLTSTDQSKLVSRESSTTEPLPKRRSSLLEEKKTPLLPKILSRRPRSMNVLKSKTEKPMEKDSPNMPVGNDVNRLSARIYKLPLPSTKPKVPKSAPKKEKRSKSLERPPVLPSTLTEKKQSPATSLPNTSSSKRKSEKLVPKTHRILTKKQQQSLSKVMVTTPRSKYELSKWDEPYVGARYDPPTPPSSPSLFVWSQDSDQEESEILSEQ